MVTTGGTANSNEIHLLRLAAAVERNSEHPLAEAVVQYAKAQGVEFHYQRQKTLKPLLVQGFRVS
jgi:Cu+-exporting ATPase